MEFDVSDADLLEMKQELSKPVTEKVRYSYVPGNFFCYLFFWE